MNRTSWLVVILTVVAMVVTDFPGRRDANAQGSGPGFAGPGAIIGDPDGTLVVIDNDKTVFRVLPNTGDRTILSSDGIGSDLTDIAREASGTFVAVDGDLDAVVRIDPATGTRTVISGCPQAGDPCPVFLVGSGDPFRRLVSIAVVGGALVVVDFEAQAVVRVDLSTGNRTILSDATTGSGPGLEEPMGIAVQSNGFLAVVDFALDAVVEIDPDTGNRRILSGCPQAPDPCPEPLVGLGPFFLRPIDLVVRPDRTLAVLDSDLGAIVGVDPITGDRRILSDAATGGPVFLDPSGLEVDRNRRLFVADRVRRAIIQVNPASGTRQIISQAPALNISPGTGTYTASQSFDVALFLEGGIDSVFITSAVLNGTEMRDTLDSCERRLTGNGVIIRCADANTLFGLNPGKNRFDVRLDANLAGGGIAQLRKVVFWYIDGESEGN